MTGTDALVIGGGISGLVDAILLAETGRRVAVVEQHDIPGGYLQQFRRKHTVFDVGFHYMGSTEPGRPMRQFLEHLRVWDRLRILPFPDAAAIEVRSGARRFAYPGRFAAFVDAARAAFPGDRAALERFVAGIEGVCAAYKWFALRAGVEYGNPRDLDLPRATLAEYLDGFELDPWLREVLEFQSFNLGLYPREIPWTKHALAFRSNFDRTARIDGGGGALVDALVARGRELRIEYSFRTPIAAFETDGRRVTAALAAGGERFEADLFVAACPPKVLLRVFRADQLDPMFSERVLALRDSRGAVQIFLRLREPLQSIGATCVLLRDERERAGDPPLDVVLITNPSAVESKARGGPRLEAMTYLDEGPFAPWRGTRALKRGPEYEAFKRRLAERMIAMIGRVAPELAGAIEDVYAATPLSDQWYTWNDSGAVFGISHDVLQQGSQRPQPRTYFKNLWFTGHSIQMPGICGVFINAFDTCEAIRGDGALFHGVAV